MRDEGDVYYRLGMRLNENQVKMLLVEPSSRFLRNSIPRNKPNWERSSR